MNDQEYAALLQTVRDAEPALLAPLRRISRERWDDTVFAGENGWTRRQLLAHMASNDLRQITRVRVGAGLGTRQDDADLAAQADTNGWNQQQVEQRAGRGVDELLAEMQEHRRAFIALLESLTPDQRDRAMPFRGTIAPLRVMLPQVLGHLTEHARELAT